MGAASSKDNKPVVNANRGDGKKRKAMEIPVNKFVLDIERVPESSFMSIVLQGSCAQEFYKFGSSCSYFWNFAKKEENRLSINNRFKEVDVVHMLNEEYPDKIHADEYKKDRSLRTWRHVNSRYPVLHKVYGSRLGIFMCELPDGEPVMDSYHLQHTSPIVLLYEDLKKPKEIADPSDYRYTRHGVSDKRFSPFPSQYELDLPSVFSSANIGTREDCLSLCSEFEQLHSLTQVNNRGTSILVWEVTPRENEKGEKTDLSVCLLANAEHHFVAYYQRYKLNFAKNDIGVYKFISKEGLATEDVVELKRKTCPFNNSTMEKWM